MKIHRVEKLTDQPWVNLFAADYEHQGHAGRWVFASRRAGPRAGPHNDAVLIVPILRNPGQPPRLVLIREFRVPVGDYVIGLPAGLIEEGETVESTIRREVREETGFEVTAIKRVTQPVYSSAGLSDEAVALAFIDVAGPDGAKPALEASEDIEVLLLDYEGVRRVCDDPSLRVDAKTWAVLYLYERLGKLD
jgi:ADP-ribose pyrophosphatase